MTKQTINTHVRWMIRRDMPEVVDIEWLSFKDYWTEDDFLRVLRGRNTIGKVAEVGETIIGFLVYEIKKNGMDILNLAVHPNWRRKGIGSALVNDLKTKIRRRPRMRIVLSDSNLDGHLFIKAMGFAAVEVLPGYFENGEDGYKFVYRLEE